MSAGEYPQPWQDSRRTVGVPTSDQAAVGDVMVVTEVDETTGQPTRFEAQAPSSPGTSAAVASAYADQDNYALSVALSDGVPHTVLGTDYDPGDLTTIPDGDVTCVAASNGKVALPAGTYFVLAYATGHYETTPPDSSVAMGATAYFTTTGSSVIVRISDNQSNPNLPLAARISGGGSVDLEADAGGDGGSNDLTAVGRYVVTVVGDDAAVELRAVSNGDAATLTEAELIVARLG